MLDDLRLYPALVLGNSMLSGIQSCLDKGFIPINGDSNFICTQLKSLRKMKLENPVIVWDINPGVAGKDVESKLLKLLEDLYIRVVFYSSSDCFSSVFMSRFSFIYKSVSPLKVDLTNPFNLSDEVNSESRDNLGVVVSKSIGYVPYYLNPLASKYVPSMDKILGFLV